MALLVIKNQVYKGETLVYEAPATITEAAILDDGIIILYDSEESLPPYSYVGSSQNRKPTKQELFNASKNVLKLNYEGETVWQIRSGQPGSGRQIGYWGLLEIPKYGWTLSTGKDYLHRLNTETGEIDMI